MVDATMKMHRNTGGLEENRAKNFADKCQEKAPQNNSGGTL